MPKTNTEIKVGDIVRVKGREEHWQSSYKVININKDSNEVEVTYEIGFNNWAYPEPKSWLISIDKIVKSN
jgi:hypothetical protein